MDSGDARAEVVATAASTSRKPSRAPGAALSATLNKRSTRALLTHTQSPSLRRIESGRGGALLSSSLSPSSSPVRRPSTAASTHSRIHQALRRNESEFVFSSKESTMDGLMYSSRFQQTSTAAVLRPKSSSSHTRAKPHKTTLPEPTRASVSGGLTTTSLSRSFSATQLQQRSSVLLLERSTVLDDTAADRNKEIAPTKHRSVSSAFLERRHQHAQNADRTATTSGASTTDPATTAPLMSPTVIVRHDEAAYVQRKRQCARTFEEMILARLPPTTARRPQGPFQASLEHVPSSSSSSPTSNQTSECDTPGGIDKLLSNGIVTSIVALSALSDQATQSHCCRALYYLSHVPTARKLLVTNGVVAAVKQLSRTATASARQDLAAILCHVCEESTLVEAVLFEGIDRCLVRLFATTHPETKRICALAVFNVSAVASKIKHFVEAFSQLLITATKSCAGHTAASSYLLKAVYNVARLPMFHAALLGENVPRFLAAQIPHAAHGTQLLALQALVSLCDAKPNRAQILSQPFCKLLEKMLPATHHDVQEMTLLVVLLLSLDDGSRIRLCTWIPIGVFLQTAARRLATSAITAHAPLVFLDSCILRNLCDSVLTHHELLEAHAMPLLLALSRVPDHEVKANAVCALVSIIASSPEESAAYVVDILDELLTLACASQPRMALFAVGAVYNIACNDDCLPLLVTSVALLDCLLALARDTTSESIAELTAAVVYRLLTLEPLERTPLGHTIETSTSTSTPTLLLQRGFFPALVRLTRTFPSARPYALYALYLLAQSDRSHTQTSVFPHGSDGVWELVNALDSTEPTRATTASVRERDAAVATARSAVSLMAALASQRANHSVLVRHGAVFRFLRSLRRVTRPTTTTTTVTTTTTTTVPSRSDRDQHHDDETVVLNSAFVFYALAVSHEGCEQLIREHGIEELIHLARTARLTDSARTRHVKELVMMTLCRVSSFLGLEVKLIEHGAIDAVMVLALVSSADSTAIKALCVKTLANCLVAKTCARPLIEHGVIWALASLATVDSPETRSACAVSLCNLATVPHMLARFLDAGAPRALVQLLHASTQQHESTTALVVVKAIANLVANEKLCLAFVNEDLERHLSVVFASDASATELRQLAAMVLLRVTSANDAVVSLEHLKHGVFVWMEQIITMEDESLVRNCMLTVHDLTCSSTVDVADMDVDHILRIVVQVFQRHASSGAVRTLCLWVLYNLSCQRTVLSRLVRPEILAFLREQVPPVTLPFPLSSHSNHYDPHHLAPSASTLTLLHGAMAQATSTSQATPPLDAKLCCYILHNLSCAHDGATDESVLASLVNARCVAILSDLYVQRDELQETCAVAVWNLAVGRVNSTRVVDDRAGDVTIHFVWSAAFHRCHYRLVSVALRKMVTAPGNHAVLLHRGIVRAIVRVLSLVLDAGGGDVETTRNLVAALSVLATCARHVPRLLQDGALPIVVAVSESKAVSVGTASAMNAEILVGCFEILSQLCTVDFEAYATSGDEINVVTTLTRLTELHQLTTHTTASAMASAPCYYARGDSDTTNHALAVAPLLTCMKKTPASANAVKKNLELQATFHVPARKWMPDTQTMPVEPPPLECDEIPLTEGSQSMPDEIKQRIRGLPVLAKEPLVRDEKGESMDASSAHGTAAGEPSQPLHPTESGGDELLPPATDNDDAATDEDDGAVRRSSSAVPTLLRSQPRGSITPVAMTKKQLQRGHAGRNLSLASSSSLLE